MHSTCASSKQCAFFSSDLICLLYGPVSITSPYHITSFFERNSPFSGRTISDFRYFPFGISAVNHAGEPDILARSVFLYSEQHTQRIKLHLSCEYQIEVEMNLIKWWEILFDIVLDEDTYTKLCINLHFTTWSIRWKNTIRDIGSIALYPVYIVYTVYTVYTVNTNYTNQTVLHWLKIITYMPIYIVSEC